MAREALRRKKAGQTPFSRVKKSISAPKCPTISPQVCTWSQKLSESSCITFKSIDRGHPPFQPQSLEIGHEMCTMEGGGGGGAGRTRIALGYSVRP